MTEICHVIRYVLIVLCFLVLPGCDADTNGALPLSDTSDVLGEGVGAGPSCLSYAEALESDDFVGGACCAEDKFMEVGQPDGCNWCSCESYDGDYQWMCTASICGDDTDAGSSDGDASF